MEKVLAREEDAISTFSTNHNYSTDTMPPGLGGAGGGSDRGGGNSARRRRSHKDDKSEVGPDGIGEGGVYMGEPSGGGESSSKA